MTDSSTRDVAISVANEAVEHDRAGRYDEALASYIKSLEYFAVAIKHEKNVRLKEVMAAKSREYMTRAEDIRNRSGPATAKKPRTGTAGAGTGTEPRPAPQPETLSEDQLTAASQEMEAELTKLIGMDSVKAELRKMCKTLMLDIQRRKAGQETMLAIRHMIFTGNPGTGKTTIARVVGRLFKKLGLSATDTVVEVQKSDLVSGYVNQTGMKTKEKIKEAEGGVLFVDEAYQLTDALSRGQSDMGGEAVDEMMRVMNETGPSATTFIFAGYRSNIQDFLSYNAGLQSRIRYAFHFEDYTPAELVSILAVKLKGKGWKIDKRLSHDLPLLINTGTTPELRAKYNGRLIDNLVQWAADELNNRLTVDASPEDLVTLTGKDIEAALVRLAQGEKPQDKRQEPPGSEMEQFFRKAGCLEYLPDFVKHKVDFATLLQLTYDDLKEIGMGEVGPRRRLFCTIEVVREERRVIDALNRTAPSVDTPSSEHDANLLQDRLDRLRVGRSTGPRQALAAS